MLCTGRGWYKTFSQVYIIETNNEHYSVYKYTLVRDRMIENKQREGKRQRKQNYTLVKDRQRK